MANVLDRLILNICHFRSWAMYAATLMPLIKFLPVTLQHKLLSHHQNSPLPHGDTIPWQVIWYRARRIKLLPYENIHIPHLYQRPLSLVLFLLFPLLVEKFFDELCVPQELLQYILSSRIFNTEAAENLSTEYRDMSTFHTRFLKRISQLFETPTELFSGIFNNASNLLCTESGNFSLGTFSEFCTTCIQAKIPAIGWGNPPYDPTFLCDVSKTVQHTATQIPIRFLFILPVHQLQYILRHLDVYTCKKNGINVWYVCHWSEKSLFCRGFSKYSRFDFKSPIPTKIVCVLVTNLPLPVSVGQDTKKKLRYLRAHFSPHLFHGLPPLCFDGWAGVVIKSYEMQCVARNHWWIRASEALQNALKPVPMRNRKRGSTKVQRIGECLAAHQASLDCYPPCLSEFLLQHFTPFKIPYTTQNVLYMLTFICSNTLYLYVGKTAKNVADLSC